MQNRANGDTQSGRCERSRIELFHPRPEHVAIPGFVYGGLLASLIDCHAIGTAAAAAMQAAGRRPGMDPAPRFVTAARSGSSQREI
jgi:hypothetical protein